MAVPGLSSGAWIELADASMDARGFQELRELGFSLVVMRKLLVAVASRVAGHEL